MVTDHPAIERLLGVDRDEFSCTYWDRGPCVALNRGGFADLLSIPDVEELLSDRGLRTPFVRVANQGSITAPSSYTRGGGVGAAIADQVADDRLAELFADGHTIVLQGLHRTWPAVGRFTRQLTVELGHPVQVNAYLTPPGNRGFAAHFDTHDVFVTQIIGRKHWRIHEPVRTRPRRDEPWELVHAEVAQRAETEPTIDIELGAGDVLYLPRGWIHAADASGSSEVSLHLTFGVHPITGLEVAQGAVELLVSHSAIGDAALRASLPVGEQLGGRAGVDPIMRAISQEFACLDPDRLAAQVRSNRDLQTRPDPIQVVDHAASIRSLDETTTVVPRGGQLVEFVDTPQGIELVIPARRTPLVLSAEHRAAAEQLLQGSPVAIKDLPLPSQQAIDLVDRLLRAGVLVTAPPDLA